MAETPEPLAGDLVAASEVLGEVFDARGILAPEGLIVTKLVSFRPQDQEDIRTLLAANRDEIDAGLIRREWEAVAQGEEERTTWLQAELASLGL
ncbi:MAG: hypothetical protein EBX35_08260 [Planctomycetia bacterium]|nr:hypothetical protein [Planctomycetia bacterium]